MYAYMYVYVYIHAYIYIYLYTHVHMRILLFIYIYVYMYTSTYFFKFRVFSYTIGSAKFKRGCRMMKILAFLLWCWIRGRSYSNSLASTAEPHIETFSSVQRGGCGGGGRDPKKAPKTRHQSSFSGVPVFRLLQSVTVPPIGIATLRNPLSIHDIYGPSLHSR